MNSDWRSSMLKQPNCISEMIVSLRTNVNSDIFIRSSQFFSLHSLMDYAGWVRKSANLHIQYGSSLIIDLNALQSLIFIVKLLNNNDNITTIDSTKTISYHHIEGGDLIIIRWGSGVERRGGGLLNINDNITTIDSTKTISYHHIEGGDLIIIRWGSGVGRGGGGERKKGREEEEK